MPIHPRKTRWHAPLVIAVVALIVRFLHLAAIHSTVLYRLPLGDGKGYDEWARRIAAGDWIGSTTFYQAPLYPYFLGVLYFFFGPDVAVARIAQAILGAATCVLFADAAASLWGRRTQWLVGLALALYPAVFFFDLMIQKSVLDLFFLGLSIALLARLQRPRTRPDPNAARSRALLALALGASTACLILTRENAILLIPVFFAWIAWRERALPLKPRLLPLACLALGLALVLTPVALRNKSVGGEFHLTTSQLGPNLYIGNNPRANGSYQPLRTGRGSFQYERTDAIELAQQATGKNLTPGEVSEYWRARVIDYIRQSPGDWLRLMLKKCVYLWNRIEVADTEDQYAFTDWSPLLRALTPIAHYGTLVPLAALGVVLTWRQRRRVGILYAVVATYALSVVIFYVFARYRLPLTPLLVMLACAGVAKLLARLRRRPAGPAPIATPNARRQKALAFATLVAAAVLANWPVSFTQGQMRASTYDNIALELASRPGKENEVAAESFYRRALAYEPDRPGVHNNLAVLLKRTGRWQEAIEHYKLALKATPDNADILYNLGLCFSQTGSIPLAIEAYHRAIAIEPQKSAYYNNLANVLGATGRFDEANAALLKAIQLDPHDPKPVYNLGLLRARTGQLEQSIDPFRRAIALDPQYWDAMYNLGNALLLLNKPESAAWFERYLAQFPNDPDARRKLGEARALR